jgi:hypothetical protein
MTQCISPVNQIGKAINVPYVWVFCIQLFSTMFLLLSLTLPKMEEYLKKKAAAF